MANTRIKSLYLKYRNIDFRRRIGIHTQDYIIKKHKEFNIYLQSIDKQPIRFNAFKAAYEESAEHQDYKNKGFKNPFEQLRYEARYITDKRTAKAMHQALRNAGRLNIYDRSGNITGKYTLKDMRSMSTQDFAELMSEDIKRDYRRAKVKGMSAKDTNRFISQYWFGSV